MDIGWLLSTCRQVDCIIIDIDNCDTLTQKFITFIIAQPNAHYITNDESTPYGLISRNRIYNLDWIVEKLESQEDEEDENDNDAQEE